jgi:hypothetical protein
LSFAVWVENGGVVGRGVLLDYKGWAESQGLKPALLETTEITVEQLNAIAAAQGVKFQPNDILFIHSGFVRALEALKGDEAVNFSANSPIKAIGVKSGEEMVRWIWEKQFAAVAGDMIAFEAHPFQSQTHWLHEWLLAGWGMPIGELFYLEKLAKECRRLKKWSFFFSSVPLKVSLTLCIAVLADIDRFREVLLVLQMELLSFSTLIYHKRAPTPMRSQIICFCFFCSVTVPCVLLLLIFILFLQRSRSLKFVDLEL